MEQTTKKENVATSNKPIKISQKEYERLQKFGYAGESINDALVRVLDIAERERDKKK